MKNKSLKTPVMILAIGLIVAIAAQFLFSMRMAPAVTEQDFNFSVTYALDGEMKTIEGVYTCRFDGFDDEGIDPIERYYTGEYTMNGVVSYRAYTIEKTDTAELYIVLPFNDSYLMGDTKKDYYASSMEDPYLEAVDGEGYAYEADESELFEMFDAEIVSFTYPAPIENSFVFAGFAGLHPVSVLAMMIVGLATLVCCMICVKKDEQVTYRAMDVFSIVLNFVTAFIALPLISTVVYLIQAIQAGAAWIYQADLCIPPIMLFTIAASVCLRRKGYRKSGFFIQFLGPVMLAVLGVLEYVL